MDDMPNAVLPSLKNQKIAVASVWSIKWKRNNNSNHKQTWRQTTHSGVSKRKNKTNLTSLRYNGFFPIRSLSIRAHTLSSLFLFFAPSTNCNFIHFFAEILRFKWTIWNQRKRRFQVISNFCFKWFYVILRCFFFCFGQIASFILPISCD